MLKTRHYMLDILATETSLQMLRILQLKLRVQLVGNRVTGIWLYRGLMPALLKQLNQFNAINSTAQLHFLHYSTNAIKIPVLIHI
jgi:hypothetical protein